MNLAFVGRFVWNLVLYYRQESIQGKAYQNENQGKGIKTATRPMHQTRTFHVQ